MASRELIGQMFQLLMAQWPREPVTEMMPRIYETVLADVPDDVLRAAVTQVLSTATFRPTAADVRRIAFELAGPKLPSAVEAWGEVRRMVHRSTAERHWTTPLIPEALRCVGGLSAFAFSMVDDEPSWRARFIEAYNTLAQRQHTEQTMLPQVKQLLAQAQAQICSGDKESKRIESNAAKD